jgi:hypothetical protein
MIVVKIAENYIFTYKRVETLPQINYEKLKEIN